MTGVLKVDDIQDAGANSIVSSNGSGTLTFGSFSAPNITASTAILPDASDGAAIGSASLEFSDLFLADGAVINFGDDQDITLTHTADTGLATNGTFSATTITATTAFVPDASDGAALGTTALEFSDLFLADGAVIGLGDDQEVTLTHVADTGITLNSTNKLMFNDASQFVQGISATVLGLGATDEIDLTATAIDINGTLDVSGASQFNGAMVLAGTTPTLTIGDAGAEDAKIVFDGNAQDFHIGLDDSADDLIIGKGSALGTTPIISMTDGGDTTITSTTSSATTGNLTIKSTGNANPAYSNIKLATAGNTTGVMIRGVQASGGNDGRLEFLTNNSGTLGIAMKMDYAGHVTKPLQPAVLYSGNNENNFTGDGTNLRIGIDSGVGTTERFDVNADQTTGTFTAPVTGKYLIVGQVWIEGIASNHDNLTITMATSNRSYYVALDIHELGRASANSLGLPVCAFADMDANDTHILSVSVSGGSKVIDLVDLTKIGITLLS